MYRSIGDDEYSKVEVDRMEILQLKIHCARSNDNNSIDQEPYGQESIRHHDNKRSEK